MRITTLTLMSALALAAYALPATAELKCWKNRDGVRECGNVVPPEYAQQETRSFNKQGVTTDVQQRAKTAAELAAEEQRKRDEEARLADEKQRLEAQQKIDRILLETFASEQDIIMGRDRKVQALQDTIEITKITLGKLEEKLASYRTRAAAQQKGGKPASADLLQDIASAEKQVESKNAYIAEKEREITTTKAQYDRDLVRYRELMQRR